MDAGKNLFFPLIGAVALVPSIIAPIVWAGTLRRFSALRKSLAEESNAAVITSRYEREIHADLLDLVKSSKEQMVNGFAFAMAAIVLWYLLGTVREQRTACMMMGLLFQTALLMWVLLRVVIVRLRLMARGSVPVVQRMKARLETRGFLHVLIIALSGILYWIATL